MRTEPKKPVSVEDAFTLGYMLGAAFHFQHFKGRNATDYSEALKKFQKSYCQEGEQLGRTCDGAY